MHELVTSAYGGCQALLAAVGCVCVCARFLRDKFAEIGTQAMNTSGSDTLRTASSNVRLICPQASPRSIQFACGRFPSIVLAAASIKPPSPRLCEQEQTFNSVFLRR